MYVQRNDKDSGPTEGAEAAGSSVMQTYDRGLNNYQYYFGGSLFYL